MSNKRTVVEHIVDTVEKGHENWAGLLTFLFLIGLVVVFALNFVQIAIVFGCIIGTVIAAIILFCIYWYLNGLFISGCEAIGWWWSEKFPPKVKAIVDIECRSEHDYF